MDKNSKGEKVELHTQTKREEREKERERERERALYWALMQHWDHPRTLG